MADFKELWRRLNIDSALIRGIVEERSYPQHISGVKGAIFPAISLFTSNRTRINYGIISGVYQMDSWSKSEEEAGLLQDYMEQLYHPDFIDKMPVGSGVRVLFLKQADRRDGAYEKDTKLFHKISTYAVVWEGI